MSLTLAGLRAQCRLFLSSTEDWPDAMLDGFIADALRAYSGEFPRAVRHPLVLTAGVQSYTLPGVPEILGVIGVEYPAGLRPPAYLTPCEPGDPQADDPRNYCLIPPLAGDPPDVILRLGGQVQESLTATVTCLALHTLPTSDSDLLTVPSAHLEALIAFVDFRCHWELEVDEAYTTLGVALTLSMLGENGRRAWNRWREVMDRLRTQGVGQGRGGVLSWRQVGL